MTPHRLLTVIGSLSMAGYAVIVWLSWRFEFVDRSLSNSEQYLLLRQRPIVPVLVCVAVLFALYLVALVTSWKCDSSRRLIPTLFGFALGFRLLLLASEPIQEVDIYRYLWDGEVTCAGVSPFRYSPRQVLNASASDSLPTDMQQLVERRDSSTAVGEILRRVHYGHLTTVYPPVSQAVFAAATATMPHSATIRGRVVIMRSWLLLFDVATAWLLCMILRHVGRPLGWVVAYAWCPLVMKEFANSGHLDSIAVCLTTAAIYFAIRSFFPRHPRSSSPGDDSAPSSAGALPVQCVPWWRQPDVNGLWPAALAAALLALAVGAKLYPIVLAPLLVASSLRQIGWKATLLPAATFVLLTGLVCTPMLVRITDSVPAANPSRSLTPSHDPPPPPNGDAFAPEDPASGLSTFLRRWEMNDFLFLLLVENVDPAKAKPDAQKAWFVVTPQPWRASLVTQVSQRFNLKEDEAPFLLTRFLTSGCFVLLALWWSWQSSTTGTVERFLECTFLTLAWFWLLLPTQNPWYWIWALPFVPFARSRVWLAMSGCVLIYYLRFWLGYHWPGRPLAATHYSGNAFFDFVVSWIEFGPWFGCLAIDYCLRSNYMPGSTSATPAEHETSDSQ